MLPHLNYIPGTYVFEKDISLVKGVGAAKKWLVFMEIQIKQCVRIQQSPHSSSAALLGFMRCLVTRREPQKRCYIFGFGLWQIWFHDHYRISILRSETSVSSPHKCRKTGSLTFNTFVHGMFNINITFPHFVMNDEYGMYPLRNDCSESPVIFTIDTNGTSYEYCGTSYPWSVYFAKNMVSSKVVMPFIRNFYEFAGDFNIILEIGVVDKHIFHDRYDIHAGIVTWSDFKVQWYRINVEMLCRVMIHLGYSDEWKSVVIIYDGPNENMPKLINQRYQLNETILSSTFQIFVVCVSHKLKTLTLIFKAVRDNHFILESPKQILSKNNSCCGMNKTKTCMNTYHIFSATGTHVTLNVISLDITGPYKNIYVSAGVAIYNVINENRSLVAHWHKSIDTTDRKLIITSTENELYLVVFSYSPFTYLFYEFSFDSSRCIGRFLGNFIRPSLTSIPKCRKPTSMKYLREECFVTFNVTHECFVVHVVYLPIEYPVSHRLITIFLAYKEALRVSRYSVGSDRSTYSCAIDGEYHPFEGSSRWSYRMVGIVDGITCMSGSNSIMNIIRVYPSECILPCLAVNIPLSTVDGNREFCDICTNSWIHRNGKYHINYLPSYGSIKLERVYGNHSTLQFCFDSAETVCCTWQKFCYFNTDTMFQFSEQRAITATVHGTDVWRTQRFAKHEYDSSYICYSNCSFPTENPFLFRFGAYEYIPRKVKWHASKRTRNWTSSSYECRKIGAQLVTVFDRRELNFIIQNIMNAYAVENVFIGMQRQVCKLWYWYRYLLFRIMWCQTNYQICDCNKYSDV